MSYTLKDAHKQWVNPYFGLSNDNISNLTADDDVENINSTIKPIDRKDSSLEAEKGELVFQPTGEVFTIQGKTHGKGGTPLNLPKGSFIFSNYKPLAISKEDKEEFKFKKGGSVKLANNTPAKVLSREIDIKHHNKMLAILKSDKHDEISKTSARLMLEKNLPKIGQVAFLQEERKGFPDDVPDFSQGTAPIQENVDYMKKQFKMGGSNNPYLPQYQDAGTVKSNYPSWIYGIKPKTPAGTISPTGVDISTKSKEELENYYDLAKAKNQGKDFSSPEEYQSYVYDNADDQAKAEMWSTVGNTAKGKTLGIDSFSKDKIYNNSPVLNTFIPTGDFQSIMDGNYSTPINPYEQGVPINSENQNNYNISPALSVNKDFLNKAKTAYVDGNPLYRMALSKSFNGSTINRNITPNNPYEQKTTVPPGAVTKDTPGTPLEESGQYYNNVPRSGLQNLVYGNDMYNALNVQRLNPMRSQQSFVPLTMERVNAQPYLNNLNNQLSSTRSLSQVMNPYQAAALQSKTVGQGLDKGSEILGNINNQNLQISNNENQYNNKGINDTANNNVALNQSYYDQTQKAEGNYQNTKDVLRNNALKTYVGQQAENERLRFNLDGQKTEGPVYVNPDTNLPIRDVELNNKAKEEGLTLEQYVAKYKLQKKQMAPMFFNPYTNRIEHSGINFDPRTMSSSQSAMSPERFFKDTEGKTPAQIAGYSRIFASQMKQNPYN